MNNSDAKKPSDNDKPYKLRDADNHGGIVPDDALQKANPAAAERTTDDHDPHHIAKDSTQYDSDAMKKDK